MKKIALYIVTALIVATMSACDKAIDKFDNSTNYIYFDMPFQYDQYGKKTTKRVDSLVYSFAMEDLSVTEYTFKIPVNSVGLKTDFDRTFKVEVDEEETTASPEDWYMEGLTHALITKGNLTDTLKITVKRRNILSSEWRTIRFRLVANENFQAGADELLTAKISFTAILQPPAWWNNWLKVFGVFSKEKYKKWQEFYYLGADPNAERYGPDAGKPLYWGQMPFYVISSYYPSTWMFITKTKQYFIDNIVYPDGDTSKPRITLP